jgi:hypothetical protein
MLSATSITTFILSEHPNSFLKSEHFCDTKNQTAIDDLMGIAQIALRECAPCKAATDMTVLPP